MVEGSDLYGDGVNIAARLQALAEPGGVVISGTIHDLVRKKFGVSFEFVGEQTVKNIEEPVPSYRLVLDGKPGKRSAAIKHDKAPAEEQPNPEQRTSVTRPTSAGPVARQIHSKFRSLPRRGRFALSMIGFFFLINLFSGIGNIWFHWPSLPFLLILLWNLHSHGDKPHHPEEP